MVFTTITSSTRLVQISCCWFYLFCHFNRAAIWLLCSSSSNSSKSRPFSVSYYCWWLLLSSVPVNNLPMIWLIYCLRLLMKGGKRRDETEPKINKGFDPGKNEHLNGLSNRQGIRNSKKITPKVCGTRYTQGKKYQNYTSGSKKVISQSKYLQMKSITLHMTLFSQS